jgi:hypothetical protein
MHRRLRGRAQRSRTLNRTVGDRRLEDIYTVGSPVYRPIVSPRAEPMNAPRARSSCCSLIPNNTTSRTGWLFEGILISKSCKRRSTHMKVLKELLTLLPSPSPQCQFSPPVRSSESTGKMKLSTYVLSTSFQVQ